MRTKFLFFFLILFTTSAMSQTIKDSTVIEVLPQYPGGFKKLLKYINKNLHVPTSVNKARCQGVIVVGFMIDRDGGVIAESIDLQRIVFDKFKISEADKSLVQEELVTEVKRLFADMPKWAPGTQNGIAVRVRYTMPLTIDFG